MINALQQTSMQRLAPIGVRNAAYTVLNTTMGHSDRVGDGAYSIGAGIHASVSQAGINNALACCLWWQNYMGMSNSKRSSSSALSPINEISCQLNDIKSMNQQILKRMKIQTKNTHTSIKLSNSAQQERSKCLKLFHLFPIHLCSRQI